MTADVAAVLRRIGTDPAAGREALALWAADQRGTGDPLTRHLALAIGEAVRAASRDGDAAFAPALLDRLGLTRSQSGKPRVNPNDIGDFMFVTLREHLSENAISASIAKAHGCSLTTGRTRMKRAKASGIVANAIIAEIVAANGLATDVDLSKANGVSH